MRPKPARNRRVKRFTPERLTEMQRLRLRLAMLQVGFTFGTLAAAVGVTQGTLHNVISANHRRLRVRRRVNEILGQELLPVPAG